MKLSKFYSNLALAATVSLGSVGVTAGSLLLPNQPVAQAQSAQGVSTLNGCYSNAAFNATIAFNPTNIRREPTTSSPAVGQFRRVGEVFRFAGVTKGSSVNDAWTGKPDDMWYRVSSYSGVSGWVAGAVVKGYPTKSNICGSLYTHPLNGAGSVSQGPGGSTSHTGRQAYAIDYGVSVGTSVYAMRSGTIVEIKDGFPTMGKLDKQLINSSNRVIVKHDDGTFAGYLHLQQSSAKSVGVSVGQRVNQRQRIGLSGSSGMSTGPHLHVEVTRTLWGDTIPFTISR